MDRRLHRLEEQFERQPQWQHPPPDPESAMLALPPPELPTALVRSHAVAEASSRRPVTTRRTVHTRSRRDFSEWHISEAKEGKKRGRKEEGDEKNKKEEAKKRKRKKKKEEEEVERKREEEEDAKRKKKEEEGAERKRNEEQRKKKEQEEDQRKKKDEEEAKRKRNGEQMKKKEEEEEERKRKRRQISPSSLYFMFHGTVEGYENFLSFHDIRELLFARESESVVIDCYVNAYLFLPREENPDLFWNFGYVGAALKGYVESYRDDKSKEQHFEYAFGNLDRAPNEFDLIFSPMHVGTNHWTLSVIHNKEKAFHVYDSLRNKHRPDIPQYVKELKSYLKGKHIDADKWPLRYPDPCPQQGSGDDCGIFTCKYMECLARRDIQHLLFSQDDMSYV
ncbi:hypothetical protein Taro_012883 [Colocasia esculenta]|uniref:Ubiquitin-like protease family profile domain-containing protein n=1 Tax=Colocasia esculenta TaxID=4460 RepID=A0A843UE94_COLES|nr:hypothetical protein [Colocasia esculenta]